MKKDQDSKFAKSFSDALRLWLRANRNRVILIVVLFVLALSFFAGEKLFSDPGDKRRNETVAETGQDPETKEHVTRVVASDTEPEKSDASEEEGSTGPAETNEEKTTQEITSENVNSEDTVEGSDLASKEETSVSEQETEVVGRETVTPVPPTEESTVQPTITPAPPVETESQTTENETEATSPETQTEAEEGYILCTITISCEHVYDNPDLVPDEKWLVIPKDGLILHTTTMKVKEGSTVYQVLRSACESNGILLDAALFSAYVRGIGNLYEFDLGRQSGWMYEVNGYYPPVGCGSYRVEEGDVIVWNYTCNRGDLQPEGEKDNGSNLK